MYAVIELKGAQIRVEKGETFRVNRISDHDDKKSLKVESVLFGNDGKTHYIGEPYVKGAVVECEILRDTRGKKVIVFKYRDRKSSQSKKGHRQDLTELRVKDIAFPGAAKAKETKETKKDETKKS